MTIPADFVLKAGHYRNKTTGTVSYYCNCSSQPVHLTLRTIAGNRGNFEVWPQPIPAPAPGEAK